jgi:hypothetical protein
LKTFIKNLLPSFSKSSFFAEGCGAEGREAEGREVFLPDISLVNILIEKGILEFMYFILVKICYETFCQFLQKPSYLYIKNMDVKLRKNYISF